MSDPVFFPQAWFNVHANTCRKLPHQKYCFIYDYVVVKVVGRHVDAAGNIAMSQFQGPLSSSPELYKEFCMLSNVHKALFWVLWFPPNFQAHASR